MNEHLHVININGEVYCLQSTCGDLLQLIAIAREFKRRYPQYANSISHFIGFVQSSGYTCMLIETKGYIDWTYC